MSTRIQVILSRDERDRFRHCAQRRGLSLSAWLRQAGLRQQAEEQARPALDTPEALDAFFAACDDARGADGAEPAWEEHLAVIAGSRLSGLPGRLGGNPSP